MREKKEFLHSELTRTIIQCCFEVMKELGSGFLENVYKNALFVAMKQKGLEVLTEQMYEVVFRNQKLEYKRLHHLDHFIPEESTASLYATEPREKSKIFLS